jgi:hypothetical protein
MLGLLTLAGVLFLQDLAVSEYELSGDVITYEAAAGESIAPLAARFGLEPRTLAADNGLSPATALKSGQALVIDNRHVIPAHPIDGILINVPQRMLFVFVGNRLVGAYPVAVGRPDWRTPLGAFAVSSKEHDPTWDVPKSIQEEMSRVAAPFRPVCRQVRTIHWATAGLAYRISGSGSMEQISPRASTASPRTDASACIPLMQDRCSTWSGSACRSGLSINRFCLPRRIRIMSWSKCTLTYTGVGVHQSSRLPVDCASSMQTLLTSRRSMRLFAAKADAASHLSVAYDSPIRHQPGDSRSQTDALRPGMPLVASGTRAQQLSVGAGP